MASKSKIVPKVKPSRCFAYATDFPDMTPEKYAPGTLFASVNFDDHNADLPPFAKLGVGSYRVEQWSEGDPKKSEIIYTAFRATSGPFEGQLTPRDITHKTAGEVTSFTSLHDPKNVVKSEPRALYGIANYATTALS